MTKKILFLGPQGSGKSTQAKLLAGFFKIPVISTGDIFRKLMQQQRDALGQMVKKTLEEGRLVDDQTTCTIVRRRLQQPDCERGFILDGYPRTLEQVKIFDPRFDAVFYLDLPEEVAIKRLFRRGREDDTSEIIKMRLDLYYRETQPLLDYYRKLGILKEIKAEGSIESIQSQIQSKLS